MLLKLSLTTTFTAFTTYLRILHCYDINRYTHMLQNGLTTGETQPRPVRHRKYGSPGYQGLQKHS